ncbi:molecular chaperone DnaJ [Burkholderia lata]|uniref:Molecular chaperone DnaJ n=1 Tax=Burkholderia lata (strain ATCC 17760 / DSM 23089 / LMG 22485 / NCIMB 9086 / R18194 / 383) TaxID=482957 RepID=A0A6P2NLU6_BURL3|nr:DnaJ C-terminal domain-containing protein [Burkholderia lata]VWB95640.1 molecular chaperone DnaJ [Burkholderia lata]VWC60612.1 molecular chaperone DnaJ [Burkholderia lata]VWC68269.1 molecular chaperone DnaJ [Burkholderia lata]
MEYKDYYEVLGLARDATQDDIKRAYRKLARKYHPDVSKHQDAEAHFKEVGHAYEVLKDPEKRAAYDRLGAGWHGGDAFRPEPNWDEGFEFSGAGAPPDFDDYLASIFAAGRARPDGPLNAGRDHHAKLVVDLEDAYRGAQRVISLSLPGIDPQGHVRLQPRTLNVSIPKGIRAGQYIRLAGQGGVGHGGGAPGDLYLEIAFRDHPRFQVNDRDVTVDLPVAPWEAALGATVTTPTPDGEVAVTVPGNSPSGRRLRLKGKGIPGDPPGNLYVKLKIVLPPADSERSKAAYDTMRQSFDFDPRAHFYG